MMCLQACGGCLAPTGLLLGPPPSTSQQVMAKAPAIEVAPYGAAVRKGEDELAVK